MDILKTKVFVTVICLLTVRQTFLVMPAVKVSVSE